MPTQITLVLEPDEDLTDTSDDTGLTDTAYGLLLSTLNGLGYAVVNGPTATRFGEG